MGDFVDHELLLSVASGIGRWVDGPAGAVYERDEDCLGKGVEEESFFRLISTMPSVFSLFRRLHLSPPPPVFPLPGPPSPLI